MAAHAYAALQEVAAKLEEGRTGRLWDDLGHALTYAPWTDELTFGDYEELSKIVDAKDASKLAVFVQKRLGVYKAEWEDLNQPATHEEWQAARITQYGPDVDTLHV
jgi:hypothetical protein